MDMIGAVCKYRGAVTSCPWRTLQSGKGGWPVRTFLGQGGVGSSYVDIRTF